MRETTRTLRRQNTKLVLKADSGLLVGNVYSLQNSRNIIGRSVEAVVAVDDVKVSRHHASIDNRNGFYYVVDLGSTNGTYKNGRKVNFSEVLSPGDEIRVGSAVFKVEILDKAKAQMAEYWNEPTSVIQGAEMQLSVDSAQLQKVNSSLETVKTKKTRLLILLLAASSMIIFAALRFNLPH